jgi:hypothetical protein
MCVVRCAEESPVSKRERGFGRGVGDVPKARDDAAFDAFIGGFHGPQEHPGSLTVKSEYELTGSGAEGAPLTAPVTGGF